MIQVEVLGTIAQLGIGLAGFSGIVLVLTHGGGELTQLEKDRLGFMLGASLGATFLALLPILLSGLPWHPDAAGRVANGAMAAYCVFFLRFYIRAGLAMRAQAPELVKAGPFGSTAFGHSLNILLQVGAAVGLIDSAPAFLLGLTWLLFHGAYQFKRILFIRPRSVDAPPNGGVHIGGSGSSS